MYLQQLPKIELHIHLEGTVSVETLKTLSLKYGKPMHQSFEQETAYFDTFHDFLDCYLAVCDLVREEEDFNLLIRDVIEYVKRNNIIHCELMWTPANYLRMGMSFESIMNRMNTAIREAGMEDRICFIIDILRDYGVESAKLIFKKIFALENNNVVGVGLTGIEDEFAARPYAPHFKMAFEKGYGLTAHTGEFAGSHDVEEVVEFLKVSRLGHGIRAFEDPELIQRLKEIDIHFEICPTSNVRLKRKGTYKEHPIKDCIALGINFSINSDDPGVFKTELTDEYRYMVDELNFSKADLKQSNLNAARSSFVSEEKKKELILKIEEGWG